MQILPEGGGVFGMKFSEKGIGPTEDRCRALWDASAPENVKDLRSIRFCTARGSSKTYAS